MRTEERRVSDGRSMGTQRNDFTANDRTKRACSRSASRRSMMTGSISEDGVVIAFAHSILIRSSKGFESIANWINWG